MKTLTIFIITLTALNFGAAAAFSIYIFGRSPHFHAAAVKRIV
jgi:hypothetical protein